MHFKIRCNIWDFADYPPKHVAGIMYMWYTYIYTFTVYVYIYICFYIYTSETLAGPSCGGTCRSFCDQRDAMSLFSRKKPKFRHLGQEMSWSWHGVGNHAAPKITGKYWDKWMLVHDQSYMCIHTYIYIYVIHNMFFPCRRKLSLWRTKRLRFEASPFQRFERSPQSWNKTYFRPQNSTYTKISGKNWKVRIQATINAFVANNNILYTYIYKR